MGGAARRKPPSQSSSRIAFCFILLRLYPFDRQCIDYLIAYLRRSSNTHQIGNSRRCPKPNAGGKEPEESINNRRILAEGTNLPNAARSSDEGKNLLTHQQHFPNADDRGAIGQSVHLSSAVAHEGSDFAEPSKVARTNRFPPFDTREFNQSCRWALETRPGIPVTTKWTNPCPANEW